MIWSLVKISIFIAIIAVLSFVAAIVIETGGMVRVEIADMEISVAPITVLFAILLAIPVVWALIYLVGLVNAVIRFIIGDETSISRYLNKNRERRGYEAIAEGMVALASGDSKLAMSRAAKAERYLARSELTGILAAEAADRSGDRDRAIAAYRKLIESESTRFAGLIGVLKYKLDEGDTEVAMKIAEKAFALNPRHDEMQNTLLRLQSVAEDWAGARKTLTAKLKSRSLPRDLYARRNAILMFADGREMIARGERDAGEKAVLDANRSAPGLVPAAVLAAGIKIERSERRTAARILRKAWNAGPHPDLAAQFAAIEPDESPEARTKRFKQLFGNHSNNPEARMIQAELCLANEDFPGARKALGNLPEEKPTVRSLVIMAAIERGQGSSDEVVRGWLTRAVSAPRGHQWVCDACRQVNTEWTPTCPACGELDVLDWREEPESSQMHYSSIGMLPLVVAKLGPPNDAGESDVPGSDEIVEGDSAPEVEETQIIEPKA